MKCFLEMTMMMIGAIDNCDWWFFHMSHMKTVSEDFNVTLDFKGHIFNQVESVILL